MSSSAALRSFEALWRARPPDSLATLRGEAMRRVVAEGLPTTRDESWRHTNLRMLSAQSFDDAPAPAADAAARALSLSSLAGAGCAPPHRDRQRLPAARRSAEPGRGRRRRHGDHEPAHARRRDAEALMRRFAASADSDRRRCALLNTTLFVDGLHVKIEGAAAPLLIVHMSEAGAAEHGRVFARDHRRGAGRARDARRAPYRRRRTWCPVQLRGRDRARAGRRDRALPRILRR